MSTAVAEIQTPTVLGGAEAALAHVVRLAQGGDLPAREELARACQRQSYLFALQLTGNREDALDLAQDAVLRFFSSLGRFDVSRPLRPWLLRIVRNLARDRARRLRVRGGAPLTDDADKVLVDPADPQLDPEQTAARHQLQRLLWRSVQELPPPFREVLALRDYLGLPYAEIAAILGVPRGTVMSRLHRARRMVGAAVHARLKGASGTVPGRGGP